MPSALLRARFGNKRWVAWPDDGQQGGCRGYAAAVVLCTCGASQSEKRKGARLMR